MEFLQQYWWILIALLGGILVFLLFVQGGQTLLYTVARTEDERNVLVNCLGHKWEFTFTTLVVFGGAFFASFPLFYSTSFGGAYLAWMVVLLCFVLQAVSYEYRRKAHNLLGETTYNVFLIINGVLATVCVGAVVGSFFTGNPFRLGEMNQVTWTSPWRGLEVLFNVVNASLGLAIFFLSRVLASLYFMNSIANDAIFARSKRQVLLGAIPFVVFLLAALVMILLGEGYAVKADGSIELVRYKYFYNLLEMPVNAAVLLVGVVGVLFGIVKTVLAPRWRKGIWFSGAGIVLAVIALFVIAGFNNTAFYPSYADLDSSLTISNASSSEYTLRTMAYVSLLSPLVIAYIAYAWRALNRKPIDIREVKEDENAY
ncbi:MAG: cytochrome d ubiquinol oxidase subunit II [Odoribacteraceae bacterium]|jgi:cytochrome d ubiquinol oxidase subunit II|nr:cytochrome d ubiquinol oxidase subunit II [Odoribacteraceae bacterium]